MIKGCFPEWGSFEQRPEGDQRVSRISVCSCAGQTLLQFQDRYSCVFCEELYNHAGACVRKPCRCQGEEESKQECIVCKDTETGVHLAWSRLRVSMGKSSRWHQRGKQEPALRGSCGHCRTLTSILSEMGNNWKMYLYKRQLRTSILYV